MCNVQQAEVAPRPSSSVCRSLFGPVDHEELRRELHSRLREMEEENSRRWDFDFQRGVPLPSSRYVWEESREDTVPTFYRLAQRLRRTNDATQNAQPALNTTQAASSNNIAHPASQAANRIEPPNSNQRCQAATNSIAQPNASQQCQASPSASNSELNNNTQPSIQPTPSASTEPNRTQPALKTSSGSCKRTHPVSHITGFFPVKKKSKVVKALCDTLHSRSPILTEHTPRKMLR
ncbi:cyclin-dependent kinase inhibitor 1C [Pyxicephalus adspersus]|uniref:cyclin-dependent kinase inhibitor 1C n=1 Tax=Pyxicephalus adspersus TaxID=30357 RepID=UPI003B5B9F5C